MQEHEAGDVLLRYIWETMLSFLGSAKKDTNGKQYPVASSKELGAHTVHRQPRRQYRTCVGLQNSVEVNAFQTITLMAAQSCGGNAPRGTNGRLRLPMSGKEVGVPFA